MSRKLLCCCATAALSLATPFSAAKADALRVAVDISPVHSLVARVMDGVGEPDLIVSPGASPHGYQMRPSQARALQNAELVVWIGAELTPWMDGAVDTLGADAKVLGLLDAEGTQTYEFREGAVFGGGDEDDHHGHDDHHKHDDHAEDDHDDHDDHDHEAHDKDEDDHAHHDEKHDEHEDHDDHAGHDDHGHDHDGLDPHAWLAPANAITWMGMLAEELSELDPENAETYRANAAAGQADIEALVARLSAELEPLKSQPFVVFHDAYQYFESSFGLAAAGAISLGDASDPSPARLAELKEHIAEDGIACILAEPQFDPGLIAAVAEGSAARTGILDPLGSDLAPGAALYGDLLQNLASELSKCLAPA